MSVNWRQLVLLVAMVFTISAPVPQRTSGQEKQLTKRQEQAVLRFARRHHPELADLLKQLNQEMTAEYEKAIRQIHVVSERLERMKDRSPDDYQLQLDQWKVDSRIQLLAARMTMSSDEQLQVEMEKLLDRKFTLKEEQLKRDRTRTAARLEKIDAQLDGLQHDREAMLKRELTRYQKLQPSRTTPTSTRSDNTRRKPDTDKPQSSEKKTTSE